MKKWGLLSILLTVLFVWLMPASWLQARFFFGTFGLGLGVVLLFVGRLPWKDEDSET